MIKNLLIIFCCLFSGDLISFLLKIPIPGNVIGMVLLVLALQFKWVKLEDVKPAADILVKNLAFLFVPPGVGMILYFDLIAEELIPISVSLLVSSLIMLAVVGLVQQKLEKKGA
ncbi:MAG: CidA/LrgA family protein [SAR324 cluster bacterium]|uniref:CidA/LrgA family protein n=1 Tax=SAR324 cluster bacterium TaxID=2024889 RepID=A0A2A4T0P4_9DELT|nr:MAG: CidA/LrgA family protein [SAR324 cluster bacterium]